MYTDSPPRSLEQELASVSDNIARLQAEVVDIARRHASHLAELERRQKELEDENAASVNIVKWLSSENETLRQQHASDTGNLVDARTAALRKLHRTRKVLRDVLNEHLKRTDSGTEGEAKFEEDMLKYIREVLFEPVDESAQSKLFAGETVRDVPSPNGSDSDKTARPRRDRSKLKNELQSSSRDQLGDPMSPQAGPSRLRHVHAPQPLDTHAYGGSAHASGSITVTSPGLSDTSRIDLSVHPPSDEGAMGNWYIHYAHKPVSCKIAFGPISWKGLRKRVGLGDVAVESLQSLLAPEHGLRLHTIGKLAFVYDPIFLEDGETNETYIIDWGHKIINDIQTSQIMQEGGSPAIFHTFVFPMAHKKRWFYIGAHTWIVKELWKVWPGLSQRSKQALLTRLMDRNSGHFREDDIIGLLDRGELAQICVQISSHSHTETSKEFAGGLEYGPETS